MPMTQLDIATKLLVHFDEVSGQFVDSSVYQQPLVPSDSGTAIAYTADSKFGGAALIPNELSREIRLFLPYNNQQPFYLEAWVEPFAPTEIFGSAEKFLLTTDVAGFGFGIEGTSQGRRWFGYLGDNNNSRWYTRSSAAVTNDLYVHVLYGQDETRTQRLFIDGVQVGSSSPVAGVRSGIDRCGIGGNPANSYTSPQCRIDELRYVLGLPCPTADFTPPAAPYANPVRDFNYGSLANPVRLPGNPKSLANFKTADSPRIVQFDINFGGDGKIVGTVKEKSAPTNLPLVRKVRLYHEFSGRFIRETWSAPVTGNYVFENIDPSIRYTVVTYDHINNYRAVIADNLLPEPM